MDRLKNLKIYASIFASRNRLHGQIQEGGFRVPQEAYRSFPSSDPEYPPRELFRALGDFIQKHPESLDQTKIDGEWRFVPSYQHIIVK